SILSPYTTRSRALEWVRKTASGGEETVCIKQQMEGQHVLTLQKIHTHTHTHTYTYTHTHTHTHTQTHTHTHTHTPPHIHIHTHTHTHTHTGLWVSVPMGVM